MTIKKKAQRRDLRNRQRSASYSPPSSSSSNLAEYAEQRRSPSRISKTEATRRIAAYVLIVSRNNEAAQLPSPPSSPPSSQEYITRAVASQQGLNISAAQSSDEDVAVAKFTNHTWSYLERQALCLLKRAFQHSYRDMSVLLNAMFPNPTAPFFQVMTTSAYSNMKGWHAVPDAQEAYASVWKWPFEQLDALFANRMARLAIAARDAGIELKRRKDDCGPELRSAKRHRHKYPLVFRNINLSECYQERDDTPFSLRGEEEPEIKQEDADLLEAPVHDRAGTQYFTPPSSPAGTQDTAALLVPNSAVDSLRYNTPVYTPPLRTATQPRKLDLSDLEHPKLPILLWRCVGAVTPGLSRQRSMYSGRHSSFPGRAVHVCSDAMTILDDAEQHLCRHKCFSPLLSSTQSLSWALMKAYHDKGTLNERFIYTVNAMAAHERTRVFAGYRLAFELRQRGRFRAEDIVRADDETSTLSACNYRGYYDLLIYGEVSGPALLSRKSLFDLETLARSDFLIAKFLRLQLFREHRSIKPIMRSMNEDILLFDEDVARVIAKLMLFFEVGPTSAAELISTFINALLDNWCIATLPAEDLEVTVQAFVDEFIGYDVAFNDRGVLVGLVAQAFQAYKHQPLRISKSAKRSRKR